MDIEENIDNILNNINEFNSKVDVIVEETERYSEAYISEAHNTRIELLEVKMKLLNFKKWQ